MGWLWKAFASLVAIMLFGVGAWPLSLLILGGLLLPPLIRSLGRRQAKGDRGASGFPARGALAALFFMLALVGLAERGTYSPIVFGTLGAVVMAWGRTPGVKLDNRLGPRDESILLRSRMGFSWVAVAEVKGVTRDMGKALAGVDGTLLLSVGPGSPVYAMFERFALSERSAEAGMVDSLREAAASLAPLGAYLLPLDSRQASDVLQPVLDCDTRSWPTFLSSGRYDLVTVGQRSGFARFVRAHKKAVEGEQMSPRVPSLGRGLAHPPLAMEVYKAMGERLAWPQPDEYATFLSSLLATRDEPVGARVLDAGGDPQSQLALVRAQGSPAIELSREQLRAVVKIYEADRR
jgi:hypothetical protein